MPNQSSLTWIVILLLVLIILLLSICLYFDIRPALATPTLPSETTADLPSTTLPSTTQTPPMTTKPPVTTKPAVTTQKPAVTTAPTTEAPIPTPDPDAPTICIDPGHGFEDPGTVGKLNGMTYYESNINMAISLKLRDALMRLGYNVIFTHDGKTLPSSQYLGSSSPRFNVNKRNEWIYDHKKSIDLVLSVHVNSYPENTAVKGSRYYILPYGESGFSARSEVLCDAIRSTVKTGLGLSKLPGKYSQKLAVLQTGIPSVLLECGFITNEYDLKNLLSSNWQTQYAKAVAQGVDNYLKAQ